MRTLPRVAQIYLVIVYLAGLAAVVGAVTSAAPPTSGSVWELCLFLLLAVLAGGKKIRLFRSKDRERMCSVSLGFAITFGAMLQFGPNAAVPVAMASCLSASLYPRRHPTHQLGFNVALGALEAWLVGLAFLALNGGTLVLDPRHAFPVVVASGLLYFALNAGGVATIVALCRGESPLAVWRGGLLWIAPSYVAGACLSTLAILLFDRHANATLLLWVPLAYLIFQSYSNHNARMDEKEKRLREKQQHIEELEHSQTRLADLYLATIKSLALAIDAKDQYTHQHILRVQRYAVATAEQLGLTGDEMEGLNTGALLHDIGKLGVPEHILLKPGRLTEDEFAQVKKHPEIGAAILDPVEFPWPVLPVVKSHHEKWDGSGYPEGLAGEDIPLAARILAVADVYDALTSNRSYRKAWTHEKAIEEIRRGGGSHFDPAVVGAFLKVVHSVQAAPEGAAQADGAEQPAVNKSDQAARDICRATSTPWALYEVTQALAESDRPEEALQALALKLEAIFSGAACAIQLRDETEGGLVVQAGESPPLDVFLAPHSSLIAPIVHGGETLGSLNLVHGRLGAFSPDDQALLEAIADRTAGALHQNLLFDRTRCHAITDPLTGLYNLRFLTQAVEQRCRRPQEPFALLCLDLDSFKPINDNFGHQKGDRVLRDLSEIFRHSVREGDVVARYGGDEFLIVLQGAGCDEATAMTRRLQDAVAGYDSGLVHARLGSLRLGVSVGFGCFPEDGQDCAALLSAADARMYHNKTERKLGSLILEGAPSRPAVPAQAKRSAKPGITHSLVFRLVGGELKDEHAGPPAARRGGRPEALCPRRKKCLVSTARAAKRPAALRDK